MMLADSEKRAADLAVTRYGVSLDRLEKLIASLGRGHGRRLDLLDALLHSDLITRAQADEMRLVLGKTLPDPNSPKNAVKPTSNDIFSAPSDEPDTVTDEAPGTSTELSRLGEYKILRRLGEGGMGAVYLAYQESQKRHVAIKVLAVEHAGNQSAIDRFYREAKSGALLRHPNIVRNLAAGQDQLTNLHYLVMEYVDGPSLDALLEKEGRLSVGDAIYIILDIARGLEHVHSRNIVHRDIKPGNILITQSGLAKISDLGLAKRTDEASHLTAARQGFGTPYYMPYEQAMNAKAADARSDIYALGATLYHLVVGEVPFTGINPVEIVEKKSIGDYVSATTADPDLPKALDTLLARMLAKEPRHRYQTVSDLIVDLERSQLAAAVPSFIDPARARLDPIVRQRLTSSMDVTAMQVPSNDDTPVETQFWYVRFLDSAGQWRKVKLTVSQIINRCRLAKFPKSVEVSPYANGDFRPLRAYEEFREVNERQARAKLAKKKTDSENGAEPEPASSALKMWIWFAVIASVGTLGAVGAMLWRQASNLP
jgi:serine/threonine-protein kinase